MKHIYLGIMAIFLLISPTMAYSTITGNVQTNATQFNLNQSLVFGSADLIQLYIQDSKTCISGVYACTNTRGLLGWWKLDDNYNDSSTVNINGSSISPPLFINGKYNNNSFFNGTTTIGIPQNYTTIGLINDIHLSNYGRYASYISLATTRINNFNNLLNASNADYAIYLGDISDDCIAGDCSTHLNESQVLYNLNNIKSLSSHTTAKPYFLFGNHDSLIVSKTNQTALFNDPSNNTYFPSPFYYIDIPKSDIRFVVLDDEFDSFGGENASIRNPNIPQNELDWLNATLDTAQINGKKVIVFAHENISASINTGYGIINYEVVTDIIENRHPELVIATFFGHYHQNRSSEQNKVKYISLYSSITNTNDSAIIKIDRLNHMKVTGNGSVSSYTISPYSFSISTWANMSEKTTTKTISGRWTVQKTYLLQIIAATPRFYINGGSNYVNGLPLDYGYHNIVGTYNGTYIKLFVDGIKISETAYTSALGFTDEITSIGNRYYDGTQWFNGSIDDVKIYNRELSAEEIRQDYLVNIMDMTGRFNGSSDSTTNISSNMVAKIPFVPGTTYNSILFNATGNNIDTQGTRLYNISNQMQFVPSLFIYYGYYNYAAFVSNTNTASTQLMNIASIILEGLLMACISLIVVSRILKKEVDLHYVMIFLAILIVLAMLFMIVGR